MIQWLFWTGVDFSVNMANLLGITYDEFNIALFVFFLPSAILMLLTFNVIKHLTRKG